MTDELSNLFSESLSFYVHICLLLKGDTTFTTNFLFNLIKPHQGKYQTTNCLY